jgi:hypothetical protein
MKTNTTRPAPPREPYIRGRWFNPGKDSQGREIGSESRNTDLALERIARRTAYLAANPRP